MLTFRLLFFSLFCIAVIYLIYTLSTHHLKKINVKIALLYSVSVALFGVCAEILVDSLYKFAVGKPLWEYHLIPIHHRYTSYYSLVIWGMYGFYLYIFHDFFKSKRSKLSRKYLILLVGIEAIVLEVVINKLYLALFGGYIFYYLPNDLWHLTSIQAIPFYILLGLTISKSIKHFRKDQTFFIVMNLILVSILVFFA
jgi:hypothetical protein